MSCSEMSRSAACMPKADRSWTISASRLSIYGNADLRPSACWAVFARSERQLRTLTQLCIKKSHFTRGTKEIIAIDIMDDATSQYPPSRSLHGKVALVTGAGCEGEGIGNGRAISIMLADEGCNVVCLDRNLEWAECTADMANSMPSRGRAIATAGNVTDDQDCGNAVHLALVRFGRLDILINNVGVAGASGTAVDVDMQAWATGLEVNVSSMVSMVKHAVPVMSRNDGEIKGSIVNMGSVAGLKGGTPHLLYPTSKGAVVNMTRAMSAHHAPEGIRVNCVCPGVGIITGDGWLFAERSTDAVHSHDVGQRHERGSPRGSEGQEPARHRGQRLGCCRGGRVSCECTRPLDYRSYSASRRWHDRCSGHRHEQGGERKRVDDPCKPTL